MNVQDFKNELALLVHNGICAVGVGIVAADLQNAAAELLARSDDKEFKKLAVKRYSEKLGL